MFVLSAGVLCARVDVLVGMCLVCDVCVMCAIVCKYVGLCSYACTYIYVCVRVFRFSPGGDHADATQGRHRQRADQGARHGPRGEAPGHAPQPQEVSFNYVDI